jgi:dihydrofolate synthase / folylpolyglutamate synthase
LYSQLPVYQNIGPKAYKADLTNTRALCKHVNNPQHKFKSIHVAGTNGKGSSSHMLAAILQSAGYRTGLFTSPHLKDFSERIRVNGELIAHNFVTGFVTEMESFINEIQPSFFELSVAMAFQYFANEGVDIAVIEVGLGGRLDSTNIIQPEVTLITNIGYDHMEILGDTLPQIAFEKAGIIKPHTPVVISERQPEVANVFIEQALNKKASVQFASDSIKCEWVNQQVLTVHTSTFNITTHPQLLGRYQAKNVAGVIAVALKMNELGWKIDNNDIIIGINKTVSLTGLKGRWQIIRKKPMVVCDTGHNAEGILELIAQIKTIPYKTLRWVFGMVKDKSPDSVLSILPNEAQYYFCQAKIERALDANQLLEMAQQYSLKGIAVPNVNEAIENALANSDPDDLIMVGGSTFVVGEVNNL